MRNKGTLSSWNDRKGYGFIEPDNGGDRVFVHITAFADRQRRPETGQRITYTPSADKSGRPRAANAILANERSMQLPKLSSRAIAITAVVVFLASVTLAVFFAGVALTLLLVYIALSLITFGVYAWDKSAAQKDARRIPENSLHLLSLLGGWPGAILAQKTLRHKTQKQPFIAIFWVTVALNIMLFIWLSGEDGGAYLQQFLSSQGITN